MFAAAACADEAAGLGRAGEAHAADPGVRDKRGARLLADPLDDVEDARGKPASAVRSASIEHDERRPLGGLQDHGVAGGERGRLFQVESMNGAFHGVMTAAGPAGMRTTRLSVELLDHALLVGLGQVGVASVVARAAGDDAGPERALEHRHVEALDGREPLDVGVDQVGEPAQVRPPAGRAERGPRGERAGGRRDGHVDLRLTGPRHLREHALVDRRTVLEPLLARHPAPADPVVGRDGDAGHGAHATLGDQVTHLVAFHG